MFKARKKLKSRKVSFLKTATLKSAIRQNKKQKLRRQDSKIETA